MDRLKVFVDIALGAAWGLFVGWTLWHQPKPDKKCVDCGSPSFLSTCDMCFGRRIGMQIGSNLKEK